MGVSLYCVHETEHHNIRERRVKMYDTSKLRGRIIEKYGSQKDFVKAIGGSTSGVSRYLSGKMFLTQLSIDRWADALDISVEDIPIFFFTKKVHETERREGE